MHRTITLALALSVLAGCSFGFDHDDNDNIEIELGELGDCGDAGTVESVAGVFAWSHAPAGDQCRIEVLWTEGALVDLEDIRSTVDDGASKVGASEEKVGVTVAQLDLVLTNTVLVDAENRAVAPPVMTTVDVLVQTDRADAADIFTLDTAGYDALVAEQRLPVYTGPASVADYEPEAFPFLAQLNEAYDAGQELPVGGALLVEVPLAEVERLAAVDGLKLRFGYELFTAGKARPRLTKKK